MKPEELSNLGKTLLTERLEMYSRFHMHFPSPGERMVVERHLRRRPLERPELFEALRSKRPAREALEQTLSHAVQTTHPVLVAAGEFRYDAKELKPPALRGLVRPTHFDLQAFRQFIVKNSRRKRKSHPALDERILSFELGGRQIEALVADDMVGLVEPLGGVVAMFGESEKSPSGAPAGRRDVLLTVFEHPVAESVLRLAFQKRFVPAERGEK